MPRLNVTTSAPQGATLRAGASLHDADTRKAARWLWHRLGWTVVPANYPRFCGDGVHCSCPLGKDCDKPGKHPFGLWRDGEAEHDANGWARWLNTIPQVNVSLLTGRRSGVVVGDVDPRHGGKLETLWERGWSQDTVIAQSGGGGFHVYAVCSPGGLASIDAYAEGIEFKADGKQVIIPPSRHYSGRTARYRWLPGHAPWECAVAPLPDAVLTEIRAGRERHEHRGEPAEPIVLSEDQLRGLARKAPAMVARYVARAKAGADGGRYNTMKHLAYQLWSLRLSEEELTRCLLAYQQEVRWLDE